MAYYSYKRVRDILMRAGWVNQYGDPINTDKYGVTLETDYDGNLWEMAADYFESLPLPEPPKQ